MTFLTILVVFLVLTNIILAILYVTAKSKAEVVVYDEDSKTKLKTRVTHIREELEKEMYEHGSDIDSWLEGAIEEELRHL